MDYPNDQAPGAPVRAGIPEHGRIPKYYAVKAHVSALLDELGEGEPLPTERDLALRFEVARETVRQALRELLLEGRLRRGFSARKDVKATDENAIALSKVMDGVEIFEPDWNDIDKNLQTYVEDWKSATGS